MQVLQIIMSFPHRACGLMSVSEMLFTSRETPAYRTPIIMDIRMERDTEVRFTEGCEAERGRHLMTSARRRQLGNIIGTEQCTTRCRT
jgi:hypothetical protein